MRQSGIGLISERDISKERVRSDMKKNAYGDKFEGQFKDGLKNGQGTYKYVKRTEVVSRLNS